MTSQTYTGLQRTYRIVSLLLSAVFVIVGILFLFIPGHVIVFFNNLSQLADLSVAPVEGSGFYRILAVGYMYVVALLAYLMYRHPENNLPLLVLINAKAASSVLSFAFFVTVHPYLIALTNGIIDGTIACGLLFFQRKMKGR